MAEQFAQLSNGELLALALDASRGEGERDDGGRWSLVTALHQRPREEVFRAAAEWCRSQDPTKRELGADILAQLGHIDVRDTPFGSRSLPILLELLADPSPTVLRSAIVALGHLSTHGVDWDPALLQGAASHPDREVRFAVAYALGGLPDEDASIAVALWLTLMDDADTDVRDWATFGLAISEADSGRIRDALFERTGDEDEETREEALRGLAQRRDERAVPLVLAELACDEVSGAAIEAAEKLARPEFLPHLRELLEANPESSDVQDAVAACRRG